MKTRRAFMAAISGTELAAAAIIPAQDEILLYIVRCGICKKVFRSAAASGMMGVSGCAVNHAPGSCCHFGEQLVTEEKLKKLMEQL